VCVELEKIWKEVAVGYWGTFHFFLEGMGKMMIKRRNSLFSD
jgi:hypothetical protein